LTASPTSTNGTGAKTNSTFSLIWTIAELLRGDVKPADYGSFILPLTVLRRLDCELERTKDAVVKIAATFPDLDNLRLDQRHAILKAAQGTFYNASPLTLTKILDDPAQVRANLDAYIGGFSPNVRDIFERFKIEARINELNEKNLLYKVLKELVAVDLHSKTVDNSQMGDAFEHLIRRFAELSNETAGEHYTPRDAIRLMVDLVLAGDVDLMTNKAPLRTVYDPTAGTGGMLSVAEERVKVYNENARLTAFGQELNDESYAICKGDMVIRGQNVENIKQGNTLSNDAFEDKTFDLMFSNPPYGVEWKKVQEAVEDEFEKRGFKGRFGPGLPRVSDGQMLFLLHLVSKMQDIETNPNGSRIAIVMNASPLFTGGAGSGESDIRRYLFENDLVEAIIGLPTEMFYNTGIATYVWILTNNKSPTRKGIVQLIDAGKFWQKMPRSLGNKRRFMSENDINEVVRIHGELENSVQCKILRNDEFGYKTIVVDRPLRLNFRVTADRLGRLASESSLSKGGVDFEALIAALQSLDSNRAFTDRTEFLSALDDALRRARLALRPPQYKAVWQCLAETDETSEVCMKPKSKTPEADADLRDTENVPLNMDVDEYFSREVLPLVADAWIDHSKTRIGFEVPFTRQFYKYAAPRDLNIIDSDLASITHQIIAMLNEVKG
jgi:type I restriction enzyme M protein